MSLLALVAKGKQITEDDSESDLSDCELFKEEYALMVFNPKRFAKKNFGCLKNRNWQGNYSFEKEKDESINNTQNDEVKKEKRVMRDSGYDCNYCHEKNHLAKEWMLRRMNEKKDDEDDKAYYLRKLEEIKRRIT